jgi:hypothetical protein
MKADNKEKRWRTKEEEYKRKWRPGKCLEKMLALKLIFSRYQGVAHAR